MGPSQFGMNNRLSTRCCGANGQGPPSLTIGRRRIQETPLSVVRFLPEAKHLANAHWLEVRSFAVLRITFRDRQIEI
jgi:hypothetical protein